MYLILELQTTNGTTTLVTPVQTAVEKYEAMSKYHGLLQYAAISQVDCHTVVILDEQGRPIARETYFHNNGE